MGSIPTIPSFAAGDKVGVAAKIQQLADAVSFWASPPKVYAYQSGGTGTTCTTGVTTVLPLNAELYDTDTCHDNTTNPTRLVAQTPGKYTISGGLAYAVNTTGDRTVTCRKNAAGSAAGGTIVSAGRSPATSSGATIANLPTVEITMAAGDYIELFGLQNSGGNLATNANTTADTWLSMKLTGA